LYLTPGLVQQAAPMLSLFALTAESVQSGVLSTPLL
jgi:hypothetical protein